MERTGGLVHEIEPEAVRKPDEIRSQSATRLAGTGFAAHPSIVPAASQLPLHSAALPRAREILLLAQAQFELGDTTSARDAQPVYLRDRVATVKGS
jgi:tRNA threonylcarbamoyladenosine biosynthesis protein TsaB